MDFSIKFMDGTIYPLEVGPSITVGELKEHIQQLTGDLAACLKLSSGDGVNFSNNSSSLSAIGLKSGSCVNVLVIDLEPCQVFLRNEQGQITTYDVMPGETVTSFKSKIYNKEKVPVDQQRLNYKGKQLDDDKKLEDYGIVSGSHLIRQDAAIRGRMNLQIRFLGGSKYSLDVNQSITVGELKKLIQKLSGYAPVRQKLSSGDGVNFRNDSSPLRDIGLKSGSFVMVLVVDPEPFQVFLRNEKGQTCTYDVMPGETVTAFKSKIYKKEKVPVDQQRLIYEGKQLDDGRKLQDYGIVSGSTVYLTLRLRPTAKIRGRMNLQIKFLNGSEYPLEVNQRITVGHLKEHIQQLSGYAPARQKLSSGDGVNFRNDSTTLRDIGLKSGSCVMVLVMDPEPFQVFLKNEKGQTYTYDVMPGETVTAFKSKIYNKERVPVNQQRLIYEGKQLDDGRKLEDYCIVSGSTIHLTLTKGDASIRERMNLQIRFLNGSEYPLEVSQRITVGHLKERIQQLSGYAPARQKLSSGDGVNFSNDASPVSAIGLKSGSCVMVLVADPEPFQVFLRNENGLTRCYDVMPGETVTAFKSKIYNKERVPVNQQRLIYEGKQLDDGKKLEDYCIVSGSTIHLTLRLIPTGKIREQDVPHKYAPHRSCESCAEVPEPSHWVMIKPYQVHKKKSISIYTLSSPAGSYECKVSSLRWSCSSPVTLQFCFIDFNILADDLSPMQYRPAGPLMDISITSGKVGEIHLPHFLCLGSSQSFLKEAVRIIHMDDSGICIEKCELRRFHARLVKPSFSILGVFYSLKSFIFPGKAEEREKQIKIHADVLVYRSSTVPLTFRAYLLPGDAQHRNLVKEQELEEGFKGFRLAKPRPDIPLQMNEFYVMKTDCNATIKPGKLMLRHSSIAPNFFNVSVREAIDFEMELLGSVDQQQVWQIDIARSECCRQLQQGNVSASTEPPDSGLQYATNILTPSEASFSGTVEMPSVSGNSASVSSSIAAQTDKLAFLERNRSSLIRLVTNTMGILDVLKEEGFHSETISEVAAERNDEARMRMILNKIKVQKQADILFKALNMHEKDILSDLIAKYENMKLM